MKKGAIIGAFLLAAHTENRTPFCHLKSGHPSQVDDVGSLSLRRRQDSNLRMAGFAVPRLTSLATSSLS
jgi:phage protein U